VLRLIIAIVVGLAIAIGGTVLVVAHGNSIRALRKHIDEISDSEIVNLEIPTGIPFHYRFDDSLAMKEAHYLDGS